MREGGLHRAGAGGAQCSRDADQRNAGRAQVVEHDDAAAAHVADDLATGDDADRAAYLAGFGATATIEAGRALGIPLAGTLLIDIYDTARGARRVVDLARRQAEGGGFVSAVRIVLSGNLNEQRIARLLAGGVPVDALGVGASLDVSADAPALDMAYKI